MIFDNTLLFSDNQAITASAASTNAIDTLAQGKYLGATTVLGRDHGKGNKISLLVQVTETFDTAAEDGTLTFALQMDSTDTFTPDKSIDLGTFTEAELVAGFQIPFDYIPKGTTYQYMRLYYTVAGTGNFTAGKIKAGIVAGVQEQ
jgi:hypothetical protein